MKKLKTLKKIAYIVPLAVISTGLIGCSQGTKMLEDTKTSTAIFPKPTDSQEQFIVNLPKLENEKNHKVEVFLVKKAMVDCNYSSLFVDFKVKDLKGFGYNYYEFNSKGYIAQTLMACSEAPKEGEVSSKGFFIDYNSKVPMVFYTPKGYEVKYQIWSKNPMAFYAK